MIELPDLVTGGLAVGMLSALALGVGLLRALRQQAKQRAEIDALRRSLKGVLPTFTAEVEHLARQRVPAAARQLTHPHVAVPGPLHPQTGGSALGHALEEVLGGVRTELDTQRTRIDAAAQAGMRGATREIQAALYRLQDALRQLQQKYDDPELAQTLFQLDHENEQSLRRAQVAAVVCGAWVGLAREESHLVEAVTGGQARLAGYHRVRVHNHLAAGTGLVSHAVEPVAIIVAELLDNALRHSAPDTDVVVNLEHVRHGACVTVDDAGLGMTQDERARAQRLVAGSVPILLTDLGDPPRMGLAAIGQLTRQFDLSVDLSSPSPYGGVRAVLRVDSQLLSEIDPAERPPAASAPRSTRTAARDGASAGSGAEASTTSHGYGADQDDGGAASDAVPGHHAPRDAGGLPQRRRRARVAAAARDVPAARPATRRPDRAAAALGALQAGTAAARTAASEPTDEPIDERSSAVPEAGQAARRRTDAAPDDTAETGRNDHTGQDVHEGGTPR